MFLFLDLRHHRIPLCQIRILNYILKLQGSYRLCNWLSFMHNGETRAVGSVTLMFCRLHERPLALCPGLVNVWTMFVCLYIYYIILDGWPSNIDYIGRRKLYWTRRSRVQYSLSEYIYIIHCIPIGQSQARICPTWSSNISYISFAKSYIGQLADNCPI